jgi:kynurenine 3-monooxygenase
MIHAPDGSLHPLAYGLHGECILSVDRRRLNETLLSAAEALPNVRIHFDHQLESLDVAKKQATFRRCVRVCTLTPPRHGHATDTQAFGSRGTDKQILMHASELVVGTDGAFSSVRKQLMKHVRYVALAPGDVGYVATRGLVTRAWVGWAGWTA